MELAALVRRIAAAPVTLDIDAALVAMADPLRVEQILGNLIGNAMAMLRGRDDPRIEVSASRQADGMILLRVCDNGPGVPADLAADLFQPFTTRRPGGTGLGLAIVRRLVEAHGGSVRLAAHEGWNCCFELTLPGTP